MFLSIFVYVTARAGVKFGIYFTSCRINGSKIAGDYRCVDNEV